MNAYFWFYLSVIAISFIFGFCFVYWKSRIQLGIDKKYFNKEQCAEYMEQLKEFKSKYNIKNSDSVFDIVEKMGLAIKFCSNRNIKRGYDGFIKDGQIKINENLTIRQKNFVIAYMIACYLRKEKQSQNTGCKTKTMLGRTADEQICDYVAAEILLPLDEISARMKQFDYIHQGKSPRINFIDEIADEKKIPISVVLQKIKEVKTSLNNEVEK